ncbi:MAG TPA: hypothetical protein VEK34_08900 [Methylocella sp.]|nr:hypothetical protein [Methylocella sp.]
MANAAVASVGPEFAGRVGATAGAQGLSIGAFTVRTVREFADRLGEEERQQLREVMERADQPLLTGLKHILQPALEAD